VGLTVPFDITADFEQSTKGVSRGYYNSVQSVCKQLGDWHNILEFMDSEHFVAFREFIKGVVFKSKAGAMFFIREDVKIVIVDGVEVSVTVFMPESETNSVIAAASNEGIRFASIAKH